MKVHTSPHQPRCESIRVVLLLNFIIYLQLASEEPGGGESSIFKDLTGDRQKAHHLSIDISDTKEISNNIVAMSYTYFFL